MRTFLKRSFVVVFITCLLSTAAFSEEQTSYENWAQFKPGSFVTYNISTDTVGIKTDTQMTYTLTEVTAEKVVLEATTITETMGMKVEAPGETFEIAKDGGTMPAAVGEDVVDIDISDAIESGAKVEIKQETVEVAGQKLEAQVITVETESDGEGTTVTLWTSEKFPGQTIKSVTEVGGYAPVTVEMTTTEFKVIE